MGKEGWVVLNSVGKEFIILRRKTVYSISLSHSYGLCGIHYIDAGYLGFKAYFTAPRKGTVWVSFSFFKL